jgi:prepilin-type N-terminal cleavage/methylation domain-containing protein
MADKKKISRKGFTLIELMIVMCIIGILMAVTLPMMMKARYTALFSVCQSNQRNIAAAMENYWLDEGHIYPPAILPVYTEGYLQKHIWCPADPDRSDYGYSRGTVEKIYTLWCVGRHLSASGMHPAGYPQYEFGKGIILPP